MSRRGKLAIDFSGWQLHECTEHVSDFFFFEYRVINNDSPRPHRLRTETDVRGAFRRISRIVLRISDGRFFGPSWHCTIAPKQKNVLSEPEFDRRRMPGRRY